MGLIMIKIKVHQDIRVLIITVQSDRDRNGARVSVRERRTHTRQTISLCSQFSLVNFPWLETELRCSILSLFPSRIQCRTYLEAIKPSVYIAFYSRIHAKSTTTCLKRTHSRMINGTLNFAGNHKRARNIHISIALFTRNVRAKHDSIQSKYLGAF